MQPLREQYKNEQPYHEKYNMVQKYTANGITGEVARRGEGAWEIVHTLRRQEKVFKFVMIKSLK